VTRANWWWEVSKVGLLYLTAALLGWFLDLLPVTLGLATLVLISYWLHQLYRVAGWLRRPDVEPPEAGGLWGEIFDSIYHLQRHDREERDRLQTAVSYLRDSFAALKNATVLIDPAGNIEWCNSAAERLLGLEYPRDRGQAIINLVRLPRFHSYFAAEDYRIPLLMESPRDAGIRLLVEITTFGRGSRLLFARDVTREERLEGMRRDFVANVSHELRTPLTVITGYLMTLLDSGAGEDEKLQRPLMQMQQQAQRMESLLRDLLWLSRLESVEDDTENMALVDIPEMLGEVCHEAEGIYPEREIRIVVESKQRLNGNYQHLYSAVSNLLLNALKYSDGAVEMRWEEESRQLCLSVQDQGPGIDPIHIPRLTERFYRVDKSRSQATGGTGLGLAIVKHVLAGHGAHLEIDSAPGAGSTFRCVFPLS